MIGLIGLVAVAALIWWIGRSDAAIISVVVVEDGLALGVNFDTCNVDVSVDIDEHDERVVLYPKNHEWHLFVMGSDDCSDLVRVELERPLSDRTVVDSSGQEFELVPELLRQDTEQPTSLPVGCSSV